MHLLTPGRAITLSICVIMQGLAPVAYGAEDVNRPRIGLVLGGGGAKGAAHIGVLRVLDELRIPVDCVAGTSMGALVGATFAAGTAPEDIERQVLAINWSRTVGSEGQRERTPISRKLQGVTYTNNLDVGIKDGKIRGSGGLLRTQDIEDVLRSLVLEARLTQDFDDLPIPFRAVSTDMVAGEMVVLREGDLAVAMRASMSVPGAFSPVVMGDKVLSDGGMMRNLPVDIARELCADVVIAVSLSTPPPVAEDLRTSVALAGRSLDVMIEANQRAQIKTLTERDVSIVVPMGDIGSAAFDRVPDAIPLGRAAALAQTEELRRYALPEQEYLAWRGNVGRPVISSIRVTDVKVVGQERVNADYVKAQLVNVAPGRDLTPAQITEDTGRIYALGDFEKVEYSITGTPDARELEIHAVEKSWGPDFLWFDIGMAGNFGSDLQTVVRAEHRRTWLNQRGGEWQNTVQIGHRIELETNLYQPLDMRQRFFVRPSANYERTLHDIYDDGDAVARYRMQELFGQLDFGVNFGTRAQATAGLRWGRINTDRESGSQLLPDGDDSNEASLVVGLVYDTRNSLALPTQGTLMIARYIDSGSWLNGEEDYESFEGAIGRAFSFRGDSLTLLAGGGADLNGTLPPNAQFTLGGIQTFPGLRSGELRGDSYWFAGSNYNWKLADIQSLFGQALYAGFRLNAGSVGSRIDDSDDGVLYGASTSIGGSTPVGPFRLSLGYVDNQSWQLQFAIGRPVDEGSILDELH
jgi:NTE family protein